MGCQQRPTAFLDAEPERDRPEEARAGLERRVVVGHQLQPAGEQAARQRALAGTAGAAQQGGAVPARRRRRRAARPAMRGSGWLASTSRRSGSLRASIRSRVVRRVPAIWQQVAPADAAQPRARASHCHRPPASSWQGAVTAREQPASRGGQTRSRTGAVADASTGRRAPAVAGRWVGAQSSGIAGRPLRGRAQARRRPPPAPRRRDRPPRRLLHASGRHSPRPCAGPRESPRRRVDDGDRAAGRAQHQSHIVEREGLDRQHAAPRMRAPSKAGGSWLGQRAGRGGAPARITPAENWGFSRKNRSRRHHRRRDCRRR